MNRRNFLATGAASLAVAATPAAHASSSRISESEITTQQPDGLNPPGIRTAGIRMVPVVGGKYKVWTKRMGSGPIKVLLLHGGPGASHEYFEIMESFLPQAGIEIYYYDQLGMQQLRSPRRHLPLDSATLCARRSKRSVAALVSKTSSYSATPGAAFSRWSTPSTISNICAAWSSPI